LKECGINELPRYPCELSGYITVILKLQVFRSDGALMLFGFIDRIPDEFTTQVEPSVASAKRQFVLL